MGSEVDIIQHAQELLHRGDSELTNWLIGHHTSGCSWSPFISTTFNPRVAQYFAPSNIHSTIYEIKATPLSCIIDKDNLGNTGASGEVLFFGKIEPDNILKIKLDNSRKESELSSIISYFKHDPNDDNREIKNPIVWKLLK